MNRRSPRQRIVIALSTIAYLFDELAKAVAPEQPIAFRSNAEHDATFAEGEHYSGTRPGFIP